jgi:L-serine dehydratase
MQRFPASVLYRPMISITELFKIGLGPSSSHTSGPMTAAAGFAGGLFARGLLGEVQRVQVTLYGSLAWTGRGHGTDKAVLLGLSGVTPALADPDEADALIAGIHAANRLRLAGKQLIGFVPQTDIVFDGVGATPVHPNTLAFAAFGFDGAVLADERFCSVGGGFVLPESEVGAPQASAPDLPYPFTSARALLALGQAHGKSISNLVYANEAALRPATETDAAISAIAAAMMACIDRGLRTAGMLPGGLNVNRRAPALQRRLTERQQSNTRLPHEILDWVSLYAIAVNEENAAGGRVVTAPTNGAAGVIPAVLRYYQDHCPSASADGVRVFLLTATAIGALIKLNASISGAEVGCQGEVGAACSMAAAGLAAVLGGTNEQIENAAEIAMEHHLGMTCDPIGGLVQIPCIERNAFGAVKAINAASLALNGDGSHHVPLDRVIATMRQTGADMQAKYKETSKGGLAVNWVEC